MANSTKNKIKPLSELAEIIVSLKAQGKRIVHSHGVFDLVHPGHIRHLEAARREGDVLVVTVTPDAHVNRGPGRPVFNQRLRAESLAALQCVDMVAIGEDETAAETIRRLRPDVYIRGRGSARPEDELAGETYDEEEAVRSVGGQFHLTDDITFSSTQMLNAYFDAFSPEADAYLREFRQQYTPADVVKHLESLKKLKVLVVGDAIVDEYHFCRPFGMASKSATIAAQFLKAEAYAGGALAVANHLSGFCKQVHLLTCLGEQDSRQEFISQHLKPNVFAKFFFRSDAPTVVKRRYVRGFMVTKLFEVSFFNDQPLPPLVEETFCHYLSSVIGDYDLVVVADFGHGLIGPAAIEILCRQVHYLAANAQLNSINLGYNVITKYPRADYICIDEEETRMASRERYAPLEQIVEGIARELNCRVMTVTRGDHGSLTYTPEQGFVKVPVLSRHVVDTTGAGDAYLALTSPCACMGFPAELLGFIGNAVGALKVRTVGNKESVEPDQLFRFIESLLR